MPAARCCWPLYRVKSEQVRTMSAAYSANGSAAASLTMAGCWNRPISGRIKDRLAKPKRDPFRSTIRSAGPKPGGKSQSRLSGKGGIACDPTNRPDEFADRYFVIAVLIQVAKRIIDDHAKRWHIEQPDAEYPLFDPADYVHTELSASAYLNPRRAAAHYRGSAAAPIRRRSAAPIRRRSTRPMASVANRDKGA